MNNNLGMYIEQLVDRTISYYQNNNIGILEKRQIPIKVIKHINDTMIVAKLVAKAKVDYFGYINNKFVEIECKQTKHDYFDLALLKKHQLDYLRYISENNLNNFILIYFEKFDSIVAISFTKLMECKLDVKKNCLPYQKIMEFGKQIKIIYPGILDFKSLL